MRVGKRRVETGRVRISVVTDLEERLVRETLRSERVEVERVEVGRELAPGEPAPSLRRASDGTLVVPVLEEVLVVERRLVLRQEIRLRTIAAEDTVEQPVTLRRQRAEVERLPPTLQSIRGEATHDHQHHHRPVRQSRRGRTCR